MNAMPESDKTDLTTKIPDLRSGRLIFISHDNRDAELAEAFSKLLSSVSAGVLKSFRSSDRKGVQGIEYGVEWYPELMSKLTSASDVVCLLTQRSLDRPWILYEAGVAKGKLDTPVYGIALGIPLSRVSVGPFAQFQNCADGEEELTSLVMQLVRRIPDAEPDRDAVTVQVQAFKKRVADVLRKLETHSEDKEVETAEASVSQLFEEVKVMFQDLPSRIERRVALPSPRYRRWRRLHPRFFHEMMDLLGNSPEDPIAILFLASFFRDDMPWIYEIGAEAYRAARSGDVINSETLLDKFQRAVDITFHGPFREELGPISKDFYMMGEAFPLLMREVRFRSPRKFTLEKDQQETKPE